MKRLFMPVTRSWIALAFVSSLLPCYSQDIEPRHWSHLPLGANFAGAAYSYTEGDIFFNPVMRIEDGGFDLQTVSLSTGSDNDTLTIGCSLQW